jgi:hypothetical protein
MLATPRSSHLALIPVIWSAIGGSAAFLLGVRADFALPVAGLALAIYSARHEAPGAAPDHSGISSSASKSGHPVSSTRRH